MTHAHRTRRSGPSRGTRFHPEAAAPKTSDTLHSQHTLRGAITLALRSLRWPICECGAKATCLATFYQLGADCRHQFINALPVCAVCAEAFIDAIQFIPLEEAYATVHLPVPALEALAKPGRPGRSADLSAASPGRGA